MQQAGAMSLRDLTRAALEDMLQGGLSRGKDEEWSVLVFDKFAQDLIAPILKVGELRKLGVTLFLKLAAQREAVPDAPAIYLCQPTEENIKLIAADCLADRYRSYNIHWTSPISRKNLEVFACELRDRSNIGDIKVKDQFLSFVSPEKDLFSLQVPSSFYVTGSVHTTDEQLMGYFEELTNGIVHVLLTLQMVPIVVSVRTPAAEQLSKMVTARIHDMIREHYLAPHADVARPVLILCDRNSDLATSLIQPFTYRALLHDTLGMHLNKVTINNEDHEMDEKDPIWQEIASAELPVAIEKVLAENARLAKQAETMTGREDESKDGTQELMNVLDQASSVIERKRYAKAHTALQTALNKAVVDGKLDEFNGIEEELLYGTAYQTDKIKALVKGNESLKGARPLDQKVRLALMQYLLADADDKAAMDLSKDLEANLARNAPSKQDEASPEVKEGKNDLHLAFKYVRQIRGITMKQPNEERQKKGFGFQFPIKMDVFKSKGQTLLPNTRIVDAVLQPPGTKRNEDRSNIIKTLDCVDPKTGQTINLSTLHFNTSLMFVIGGGNFVEYEDVKRWERQEENASKSVIYGTTELMSGSEFLSQLAHLGQEY